MFIILALIGSFRRGEEFDCNLWQWDWSAGLFLIFFALILDASLLSLILYILK